MFLTPRHSQMAARGAGPKQTKAPGTWRASGVRQRGRSSGPGRAAEQWEAGPDSRPPRPRAAPARHARDQLLTVGTFEGIFRPLKIGWHLGGWLSSPGVSKLPNGPGRERRRRGTSVRFHAPRQQSPAPSRPKTERKKPRDPRAAALPPPRPRM
ncbi:uncharacterized protein LOC144578759 [Callithrix jacchus]